MSTDFFHFSMPAPLLLLLSQGDGGKKELTPLLAAVAP